MGGVRVFMHLDWFRLAFFFSPLWVTSLWAPLQRERSGYRMVAYTLLCFLVYWSTLQAFPVQCRHAWGIRMVSDKSYWMDQSGEIAKAIDSEKDNFFVVKGVSNSSKSLFWPARDNPTAVRVPTDEEIGQSTNLVEANLVSPADEEHSRVRKWISPLTGGGLSIDFLLLRAYCNMHRNGPEMPHVFPLRALGIMPEQVYLTVPCPYWSCVMTEARPDGKLPFFAVLGAFTVLNYAHYRCDCLPQGMCQTHFGSGQCRVWWAWFWATFLPLWIVMLVKTTLDMELTEFVGFCWANVSGEFRYLTSDESGKVFFGLVFAATTVAVYYYRDRIWLSLGLDEGWFLPHLLAPALHPEDHNTFQVCLWRLDTTTAKDAHGRVGAGNPQDDDEREGGIDDPSDEEDGAGRGVDQRSLVVCGRPKRARGNGGGGMPRLPSLPWSFGDLRAYLPMLQRGHSRDTLKTQDGSAPALSLRFFYGVEEVQSTRVVKPTAAQWMRGEPVYFQETFRMNIDWRPRTKLRVEVYDVRGQFSHVSLGHVAFDEASIVAEFEESVRAQEDNPWHSTPVTQVVRMLEPPGGSRADETARVRELRNLGFAPHRLSDGGSLWLAFAEIEAKTVASIPLFC